MTCLDVLEIEEIQSDKKYNQLKEGGGIDIVIYSAFSFAMDRASSLFDLPSDNRS